jgi:D-alanine-D-alanine ligase
MSRLKVAVLAGGLSNEWQVSVKSGLEVKKHLPQDKYDVSIINIARDGRWLKIDRKKAVPLRIFHSSGRIDGSDLLKFDVAFNALHGTFGEDGNVQAILETIGLPYTGSGVLASALGMNKLKAAELIAYAGIPVPQTLVLKRGVLKEFAAAERRVRKEIGYPAIVKPNESGSSVGVSIVREARELAPALQKALKEDDLVLVQEYIEGRELTCGVLGNSSDIRGKLEALPPVEIIAHSKFFDYEAKYNSKATEEICPAPLSPTQEKRIMHLALEAHKAIGADGLSRSDFILAKNKFYFLEINTSPGLTAASLCPKEARAAGMEFSEFLDRIVELSLEKWK